MLILPGGTGGDYSYIQVIKITDKDHCEQVAVYQNNLIAPYNFAVVVNDINKMYNNCPMMIENNEIGEKTIDPLWYDLENDNICCTDKKGIGTRATKTSKLSGNLNLKRMIEENHIIIHDAETVKQLSRYEEVSPNVYKCPAAIHDDAVASLWLALYYLTTYFYDPTATNPELSRRQEDAEPTRDIFFNTEDPFSDDL